MLWKNDPAAASHVIKSVCSVAVVSDSALEEMQSLTKAVNLLGCQRDLIASALLLPAS